MANPGQQSSIEANRQAMDEIDHFVSIISKFHLSCSEKPRDHDWSLEPKKKLKKKEPKMQFQLGPLKGGRPSFIIELPPEESESSDHGNEILRVIRDKEEQVLSAYSSRGTYRDQLESILHRFDL